MQHVDGLSESFVQFDTECHTYSLFFQFLHGPVTDNLHGHLTRLHSLRSLYCVTAISTKFDGQLMTKDTAGNPTDQIKHFDRQRYLVT